MGLTARERHSHLHRLSIAVQRHFCILRFLVHPVGYLVRNLLFGPRQRGIRKHCGTLQACRLRARRHSARATPSRVCGRAATSVTTGGAASALGHPVFRKDIQGWGFFRTA